MKHISELFSKKIFNEKDWLVIGKGPSFADISKHDITKFYSFGLNHVIKKVDSLDITHLIDFNVFEVCQEDIYNKAKYLLMPINPHFDNKPSEKTLKTLIKENEILKKLSDENRLFWYNHLDGNRLLNHENLERKFYEDVIVKYFSAEAALYILGMYNFKKIYSIGLDGGSSHDQSFKDCAVLPNGESSLLSNGRNSFDIQFDEIIKTIDKFNINYEPLTSNYPVKVYVGSQEEQMLSVKVLEYSIKKRTDADIEVFPLHKAGIEYPIPKDPNNRQRTPFSFQRFLIPQLNEFKGRAIYVDSDMQVFQDIKKLWNIPMAPHDLITVKNIEDSNRIPQFSVMLLDCERLKWSITDIVEMLDNNSLNYDSLMKEMKVAKSIGVKAHCGWNCLEWYNQKQSALVHYTDMPTQPWVSTENPLGDIWINDLLDAISEGFISIDMVKDHVEKGWVRPSLLYQVENKIVDSINLSQNIKDLDKDFIAPFKKLLKAKKQSSPAKKVSTRKKVKEKIKKRIKKISKIKDIFNSKKNSKKKVDSKNNSEEYNALKQQLPLTGYESGKIDSGNIQQLSDAKLEELNQILPWNSFTVDLNGRRFGSISWKGKRAEPQSIPDSRILEMDRRFKIKDKSVLEVGCFEGIHTIALCQAGAKVDALDVRMSNVVKTIVRCNMFGYQPNVKCLDVEQDNNNMKEYDFTHHVGVLYHLKDPVSHLKRIAKITNKGLMLDTHYATAEQALETFNIDGKTYKYRFYKEHGYDFAFAGAYDHAKWLTLDDIKKILSEEGFSKIEVANDEEQRNGHRCLIFAQK